MSIAFKKIQESVETEARVLVDLVSGDLAESHDFVESLASSLELHGVYTFHLLRALKGDSAAFEYTGRVWNAMVTELGWLLGALPDDPGSNGGAPTAEEGESVRRSREDRWAARVRRLEAQECLLARRGYFATPERLFTAALEVAEIRVRRGVGYFPDRSQDRSDYVQVVAKDAARRCERNWRPELSPLRHFLCNQVGFALAEELRSAKRRRERLDEVIDAQKREMTKELRSDERDEEEALLRQFERRYRLAKAQLIPAEQAEVERVLRPGVSRTEAERSRFRRAKRKIQRYYDEHPLD